MFTPPENKNPSVHDEIVAERAIEATGLKARRAGLLAATLSSFLTAFLASSANIALPALQKEFQINAVLLGWVAMSGLLAAAMFVVPIGRIADIYGRKKIFTYGMVIFTAACLLCGLSGSVASLMIFMVIQGIGVAMIFATSIAIVTAVYPVDQRGRALGITVASVYFGLSSGPFFGGLLTSQFGWRSIFLAVVPLGLIVILTVSLRLQEEWKEAKGETFDFLGSGVYSLSLFLVVYGFSRLPGYWGFLVLGAGILSGALFFVWESRVAMPILQVSLLKANRVFAFSNLAALIHYSATSAVTFLLSLYLQYVRGMTPRHAGLILVCQPLVQAVLTPFAGKLSDRIDSRIVSSVGMGITGVSLFLLSRLTAGTPVSTILGILSLLGLGFALFASPNMNAIMSSLEKRFYGVGTGILATARMVGQTFSMGFMVLVFSLYLGRVRITPDLYPIFMTAAKMIFVCFALLCCASIAASLARGNVRPPE